MTLDCAPAAVLAIGGTDSSGGAGLTRDAEMLAECGVAGTFVVTAVTAQCDARVLAVQSMSPRIVREQIRAAFETHAVRAVKIGMLGTRDVIEAVADALPSRDGPPIVLDPVLAASSGGALLEADALDALRATLLPRAALITPNLSEAASLLREGEAQDEAGMTAQAVRLRQHGPGAVLLKGGHADGTVSVDVLVGGGVDIERLSSPRVAVRMRGTGCMLASAIAAGLTLGMPLAEACRFGKRRIDSRLARACRVGSDGRGAHILHSRR
ncbi:MAG TPA: bifunctional hydroxymethylpyrimidine kinase/phosphomethylpyrimidine kinase [Gammaproteobacteria bacterium]